MLGNCLYDKEYTKEINKMKTPTVSSAIAPLLSLDTDDCELTKTLLLSWTSPATMGPEAALPTTRV